MRQASELLHANPYMYRSPYRKCKVSMSDIAAMLMVVACLRSR